MKYTILIFIIFLCIDIRGQKSFDSTQIDSLLDSTKLSLIVVYFNSNGDYINYSIQPKMYADRILNKLSKSSFGLKQRSMINFPVPSVRPENESIVAFDIMPNGNPTPNITNGVAWIDVCDVDCLNSQPPINAVRLGAKTDVMQIGSRAINSAVLKDLQFIHDDKVIFTFKNKTYTLFEETTLPTPVKGGICFVNSVFYKCSNGINWVTF